MKKKVWDFYAPIYERAMRLDSRIYKAIYHRIPKMIAGRDVLEIATGPGLLAKNVAYAAKNMIATDYSDGMIAQAKKRYKKQISAPLGGYQMNIEIRKLTPNDAEEYIRFFDTTPHDDGKPENTCYCVSWCSDDHRTMAVYPSCEERRSMAVRYIKSGQIQGYLAYADGRLVGWCNANTRSECINCGGWLFTMPRIRELQSDPNEKVKSVYCFLIAPEMKRKGIAKKLLQYVCQDAAQSGFDYVEAYPQKELTDERMYFMGFVRMYQDLGFHIHTETEDKYVMRKPLRQQ